MRTEDDNWKNLTNLIIVTQDDDHDGDDLRHSYHYHVIVMETMIEMMGMIWGLEEQASGERQRNHFPR